jgi:hypothetical protein
MTTQLYEISRDGKEAFQEMSFSELEDFLVKYYFLTRDTEYYWLEYYGERTFGDVVIRKKIALESRSTP